MDQSHSSTEYQASIRDYYTRFTLDPNHILRSGRDWSLKLGYPQNFIDRFAYHSVRYFSGIGQPLLGANLRMGETVVDLGCGSGVDLCLAGHFVGSIGRVYGIDITGVLLQIAKRQMQEIRMPQVILIRASMDRLPLPTGVANLVISNNAIHLCAFKKAVISEMYRVLRPGGRIKLMELVPPLRRAKLHPLHFESFPGAPAEPVWNDLLTDGGFGEIQFHWSEKNEPPDVFNPLPGIPACIQAIKMD